MTASDAAPDSGSTGEELKNVLLGLGGLLLAAYLIRRLGVGANAPVADATRGMAPRRRQPTHACSLCG